MYFYEIIFAICNLHKILQLPFITPFFILYEPNGKIVIVVTQPSSYKIFKQFLALFQESIQNCLSTFLPSLSGFVVYSTTPLYYYIYPSTSNLPPQYLVVSSTLPQCSFTSLIKLMKLDEAERSYCQSSLFPPKLWKYYQINSYCQVMPLYLRIVPSPRLGTFDLE